jgi:hypothetical protein
VAFGTYSDKFILIPHVNLFDLRINSCLNVQRGRCRLFGVPRIDKSSKCRGCDNTVPFDPQREMRFAVVGCMAGFLAIYINSSDELPTWCAQPHETADQNRLITAGANRHR